MSDAVRRLQPQALWNHFADLNAVPRPSKKEERVVAFMVEFGRRLGLQTEVDAVQNVLIRKPATPGMENRKTVVLQAHLDMVHQKNADTQFDFDQQGIDMYVEGDWVRARGTTLGADNGLGVAAIMALLSSTDIPHPALEALFTIDEETGMTGAKHLQGGWLTGDILLNLDTEEDDEIDIGCAGGIDVSAQAAYDAEAVPANWQGYTLVLRGLQGGHSGMDIHRGFGNANKLMNRLIYQAFDLYDVRIVQLQGGGLRNAIPRESRAELVIDAAFAAHFESDFAFWADEIRQEFKSVEPGLEMQLIPLQQLPESCMEQQAQQQLVSGIYALHNGVFRMSPDFEGLVEASNNIAQVQVKDGLIQIHCLTRSSVESSKMEVVRSLCAAFELMGAEVTCTGSYPGWTPNPESAILQVLTRLYTQMHGQEPLVVACHAGLECGILGQNYPNLDMISFGPTIRGAHSPDERASISSAQKFWAFLCNILAEIPNRS